MLGFASFPRRRPSRHACAPREILTEPTRIYAFTHINVCVWHVQVWGGTREESNNKVLAFFESSHFQVRALRCDMIWGWMIHTWHGGKKWMCVLFCEKGVQHTKHTNIHTHNTHVRCGQEELPPVPGAFEALQALKAKGASHFPPIFVAATSACIHVFYIQQTICSHPLHHPPTPNHQHNHTSPPP